MRGILLGGSRLDVSFMNRSVLVIRKNLGLMSFVVTSWLKVCVVEICWTKEYAL